MKNFIILSIVMFSLSSMPLFANSGSCQLSNGICIEFQKGYTQTEAQNSCMKYNFAVYSASLCSSSNIVARCDTAMTGGTVLSSAFYSPYWEFESVKEKCIRMNGKIY